MSADEIIARLFSRMAEQGRSVNDVAREAGFSDAALNGWRRGSIKPSLHNLLAVAEVVGLTLNVEIAAPKKNPSVSEKSC